MDATLGQLVCLETNDDKYLLAMRKDIEVKQEGSSKVAYQDEETLLRYTEWTDSEFVTFRTEYLEYN